MQPANIVKIGSHRINWDNVAYVDSAAEWQDGDRKEYGVIVHFTGSKALCLQNDDASDMLDWMDEKDIPF